MSPSAHRLPGLSALACFFAAALSLIVFAPVLYQLVGLPAMVIIQVVFIAGPVLLLAAVRGGSVRLVGRQLGVRWPRAQVMFGAVLVGASFWYVNLLLVAPIARRYLRGIELERAIDETILGGQLPLALVILIVSVFPAICEELLMRGALTRALVPRLGAIGAVVVSALLFGLMHLHPAQMLTTLSFGLVLGAATVATDSVVPAVVMHFLNNALVLLVGAEVIPGLTENLRTAPLPCGVGAGFLCISGGLLIWRGSRARLAADARNPS